VISLQYTPGTDQRSSMKTEIKTTIYDIFGYLVPGYLCLSLLFIAYNQSVHNNDAFGEMYRYVADLNLNIILLLTVGAYVIGHILSALSSLLIERGITKIIKFNIFLNEENLLGKSLFTLYENKFESTFHCKPDENVFRLIVCFVESKQPSVYSTAFVFLSFYGMARNFTLVFSIFSGWELLNAIALRSSTAFLYFVISIILTTILYYQYIRFFKYFKKQILCAFLLPE